MKNETTTHKFRNFIVFLLRDSPPVLTLFACIGLTTAASFYQLTSETILQGLLAVNVLIAATLLSERWFVNRENRNMIEKIGDDVTVLGDRISLPTNVGLDSLVGSRKVLPPLEGRLAGSTSLKISGGSLFRLANEYRSLFEELAEQGCSIQLVVCHPDSDAVERLCNEVVYESDDIEAYRHQCRSALRLFEALAEKYDHVEVRTCDIAMSFSILAVEKLAGESSASIELYAYKVPARNRPMLHATKAASPDFHAMAVSQFDSVWSKSMKTEGVCDPNVSIEKVVD
ncbi:hypothetical protein CLV80_11751 [Yoonia maritima]|uniref:Uncharacterized protein n=1 Tax=Yoonia maritima TaxID=1435347 RepID=A0A2T0VTW1_9RHOB|nr:hypothetical protein [Yoonia maritima]PRY74533.1 hypothetical protein CLV80_11751 [Yoonia maritima]